MKNLEFLKTIPDGSRMTPFNDVFLFNNRLCATDVVILFICDKPEGLNDKLKDGTSKIDPVYNPPQDPFKPYSIQSIRDEASKLPQEEEYEYKECIECNGDGEVEYTYESKSGRNYEIDHDCPKCNGDGHIKLKTGRMIPDVNSYSFGFENSPFNILNVLSIFNIPNCPESFEAITTNKKLYFRIGEFEGVLMGQANSMDKLIKIEPLL